MAQSRLFYEIAPIYSIIIWRNRMNFLTLRQKINTNEIWKEYNNMYARKVNKQVTADDLFKKE